MEHGTDTLDRAAAIVDNLRRAVQVLGLPPHVADELDRLKATVDGCRPQLRAATRRHRIAALHGHESALAAVQKTCPPQPVDAACGAARWVCRAVMAVLVDAAATAGTALDAAGQLLAVAHSTCGDRQEVPA